MILGISGSPTKDGNNVQAVDYALSIARDRGFETRSVSLAEVSVAPCSACGACREGDCVIEDDMQEVYDLMRRADGIFFASPVYMGGMSAQMKALLDRSVLLRRHDFELKNKVAGAAAIGASRNGGQELVLQQLHAALHIHGMIIVGDDSHFGATLHAPIEEDEWGQGTLDRTMEKMCDVLDLMGRRG